ncbi:hypothetical protein QAD02_011631 [Eretmocerus hayati]|uniref:Uncharacterized protein n=1 Tax=Eretmocerus hayati TaxID=131215 RepID=A0ACC2NXB7_9HYME|nr:hypothetical protein QAD02_011631 [Eretmocerus hayati]
MKSEHIDFQCFWLCSACEREWKSRQAWSIHFPKCKAEPPTQYQLKCESCEETFGTERGRLQHERWVHRAQGNAKRALVPEPKKRGGSPSVWSDEETCQLVQLCVLYRQERHINVALETHFPDKTNRQIRTNRADLAERIAEAIRAADAQQGGDGDISQVVAVTPDEVDHEHNEIVNSDVHHISVRNEVSRAEIVHNNDCHGIEVAKSIVHRMESNADTVAEEIVHRLELSDSNASSEEFEDALDMQIEFQVSVIVHQAMTQQELGQTAEDGVTLRTQTLGFLIEVDDSDLEAWRTSLIAAITQESDLPQNSRWRGRVEEAQLLDLQRIPTNNYWSKTRLLDVTRTPIDVLKNV